MDITAKGVRPQGIDYAWEHPSIASLLNWGAAFVCRYVSPDSGKNETLAEAQNLAGHGIWSVLVYEATASRATSGFNAGADDARRALSLARGMHMSDDRPIYFAVDFDVSSLGAIRQYFEGVVSVMGLKRTGVYGGYSACKWLYEANLVKWIWQTYAWSGGKWYAVTHIQQYHNDIRVGGIAVDANRATVADYGQWKPGISPGVTPDSTDTEEMMFGGQLNLGMGAETPIALPEGKYSTIGFNCDNERTGSAPVKLRVAIWSTKWDVSHVAVDGSKGQTVINFPNKAKTSGITVVRDDGDPGTVPVAFEVS